MGHFLHKGRVALAGIGCALALVVYVRSSSMCPVDEQLTNAFQLTGQASRASQVHSELRNKSQKVAVVTALWSDGYVNGVRVLGHSIRQHRTDGDMVAMYITGKAGWEMRPVKHIRHIAGTPAKKQLMLTKLRVWEMEEYEKVVFLDADTFVVAPINDLFDLPGDFAAARDVYLEFYPSFNSGVMMLKPATAKLHQMLAVKPNSTVDELADQPFLNSFWRWEVTLLPYKYNGLVSIPRHHPAEWEEIKRDVRIVHFTLDKPFNQAVPRGKNPPELELRKLYAHTQDAFEATTDRGLCGVKPWRPAQEETGHE